MPFLSFFFFNDTATTEIYTLSLHDALPISIKQGRADAVLAGGTDALARLTFSGFNQLKLMDQRSEEHTSELQSRLHLVCRLLLEKKKKKQTTATQISAKACLMRVSTSEHRD